MVLDAVRGYLQLASGVTEMSRQRALSAARSMLSGSGSGTEQVSSLAEDIVETSRSNRDALVALIRTELDRALSRLGLATAEEVAALSARITALEAAGSPPAGPAGPPAARPAAKRPAKKVAAAPAKQPPGVSR